MRTAWAALVLMGCSGATGGSPVTEHDAASDVVGLDAAQAPDAGQDVAAPVDAGTDAPAQVADACAGWGCGDAWGGWVILGNGAPGCSGTAWQHDGAGMLSVASGCTTPDDAGVTCCQGTVTP